MTGQTTSFFFTDGTMPPTYASYVERRADRELLQRLEHGEFCYVLTTRQMGKSSLMARTQAKLRSRGTRVAVLDLEAPGVHGATPELWYNDLLSICGERLGLENDFDEFRLAHSHLGPLRRLFAALREVALKRNEDRVVVFVDEVERLRSAPFRTDDFFGAIRECYNRRAEDPELNRLTFCLIGTATPAELIQDGQMTPFNLGKRIELNDFTPEEARPLAAGFGEETPAAALLARILHWTHGHPFLTQFLCGAVAETCARGGAPMAEGSCEALVDELCAELFFSARAREANDNLLFVGRQILQAGGDVFGRLQLYDQVWRGERVPDDEANVIISQLQLAGVVRVEDGFLTVRNRIYHRVFDHDWILKRLPIMPGPGNLSIAVLPFANVNGGEELEYLADGLTDGLIMSLGRIPGLRVASRMSVFVYKGKFVNIRQIGLELGVAMLVNGAIQRRGDHVRISVQLVRAGDGCGVWSETFNYHPANLWPCQEDISGALLSWLGNYTGLPPAPVPPRSSHRNTESYNLYLKGIYYWNLRTREAFQRSIQYFEKAIQADPHSGLAYAGLAYAWNMLAVYRHLAPSEVYPRAKEAADRALQLEPQLVEAHTALGWIYAVHYWDWTSAEREFLEAIRLNPSYAIAHQWFGINCLTPLGRHDEALGELARAREVDPLSISVISSLGLALHYAGRYEDAIAHCRETIELDPEFYLTYLSLGWACQQLARLDEAQDAFVKAIEFSRRDPVAVAALACVSAARGARADAELLLRELRQAQTARYVPGTEIALVLATLGQIEPAVDWIQRALEQHEFRLIYCRADPRFALLAGHPEFQKILRQLNLAP